MKKSDEILSGVVSIRKAVAEMDDSRFAKESLSDLADGIRKNAELLQDIIDDKLYEKVEECLVPIIINVLYIVDELDGSHHA